MESIGRAEGFMKSMRFITTLIVLTAAGLPASLSLAATPKDLVKCELLANVKAVKSGEPFKAGILLTIKPAWHVYWKNPGDSGAAPKVKWNLPAGWKAGELQFPLPARLEQPGELIAYGYESEVMLLTDITPPTDLQGGSTIDLSADVSWLVCEKVCIPGKEKVNLSLSVGTEVKSANEHLFAKWMEMLPTPAEFKGTWDGTAVVVPRSFAGDAQVFPAPPDAMSIENLHTETKAGVTRISFSLVPPPKSNVEMQFLVTYKDSTAKRHGVEFTVNIPPAK